LVNPASTYSPYESDGEPPFGYLAGDDMSGSGGALSTYVSGVLENSSASQIDSSTSATGSLSVPGGYAGTSLDVGVDSLMMTVTDTLRNPSFTDWHDERWHVGNNVNFYDDNIDVPDSWTLVKSVVNDDPHPLHRDWELNDYSGGYAGSRGWRFEAEISGNEVLDPDDAIYLSQYVHAPWRELYEIRISFYYYVTSASDMFDHVHLFFKLGNLPEEKFHVFESGDTTNTWLQASVTYTTSQLPSVVLPNALLFSIGLGTDVSGTLGSSRDAYVFVDEVEIEMDVRPFPEQIGLSANNTAVVGSIAGNISTFVPDNDGRDCWDYTSGIDLDGYNNDGRPEWGLWGTMWNTSYPFELGLQFPLDIPQGAIIESAYVEMESSSGSGYVHGRVHVSNELAGGGAIDSFSNHIGEHLEDAYSWLDASFDWQLDTWTNGVRYATPDIAPLLQRVVSSSDWASGQYIALMVSYMWSSYYQYYNNIKGSMGYDGENLARLYVSYRMPLDDDIVLVDRELSRRNLQYQKEITVDHTKVTADLNDFPLLINIIDTDLHTDVLPGGEDIAFMVDGQFVEHEIEYFDRDYSPSEAHLIAWVKVPFLSSSSDTIITMLYGNSDARSLETSGVWSDYEMVHHMNEAPNRTLIDSSGNLHYGSSFGSMTDSQLVAGAIGSSIDFDGSNDAITVGQINTDEWPSFTVTGWVNQDVSGDDRIFSKAPDTNAANALIHFAIDDTNSFRVRMRTDGTGGGSSGSVDANALTTPGNWAFLAWSWSEATASMRLYVNGTFDKAVTRDGDTIFDSHLTESLDSYSLVPFIIGNWQTGTANNRFFNGQIDEMRLTQIVLSDGWIETEFNNQLNPSTFYSVGSEVANSMVVAYQSANIIFSTVSGIPVNIGYTLDIGYEGAGTSLDENFTEGTSFSITNGSATVDWTAKVLISPPLGTQSVEMSVQYPGTDWTPISVYNPLNQIKTNPTDWVYSGGVLTIKPSAIDIYGVWTLNFEGENHVSEFKLAQSGQSLSETGSFDDQDELIFQGLTPHVTSAASQLKLIDPDGAEWYTATNTTVAGTSHEIPTFKYRKDITVDNTLVDADLTNFPMLVDLINPDFHDAQKVQADGDDILFVQNGMVVAHEVQSFDRNYDASNGQLIAWVKVNLSGSVDTTITMYYGNPLVGPQERPAEVWSDDYVAVWHLEESPTGALHEIDDSTSYQNDGTAEGATLGYASTTSAKVGSGLLFDEVDDLIRMNDSASLDSIASSGTFQLWIWWETAVDGDWQTIMASSNAFSGAPNDGYEWAVQNDGDHYFYPWRGDGACYNLDSAPVFNDQQWYHLAVTLDYSTSTVDIYLNGNPLSFPYEGAFTWWSQIASSDDILWGGHPDTASRYFDGMYDEIRASTVVRSQAWLSTEFANQNNTNAFYSVGSEVERSQVSPSFTKTMTSGPAGLWTALIRYNDTGSNVDYMVGAYERSFIIRHDTALTLQSPGDAVSSGVSVRLAGEMLHVEVELTDEDASSQPVAGATVTMNWTDTGSPTDVTLEDYGTGVYGVALNTSDLATAGSWRIDIQSSHEYYNDALTSFDLKLYHDTILKFQWLTTTPVGLDTTLTLVYTSAFDGTPIEDATISFANGTEINPDWHGGGMYNITLGSASLSMGDHLYTLEASRPTAFMIDANVTLTLTIRPHFTAVSTSGDFIQPWGETIDITILLIDMDTGQPVDIGFVQSFTFSWDATGDTDSSPADYLYLLDSSSWGVGVKSVTLSVSLTSSDFYLPDDYSFDVTIREHYTAVSVSGILVEPYGNNTDLTVVVTDLDTGAVFDIADLGDIDSFGFTSAYGPQTINFPSSYDVLLITSIWNVGTTSVTLTVTMSGSDYFAPSNYIFPVQIRTLQSYLYNEPSDLLFPNGDDFAIYLHVDVVEPNSQYYGDFINDLETSFTVTNASFTYPKTITPLGNGRYYLVIDTSYFPEGSYTITVTVDDPFDNFALATLVISFSYQPAESQLSSPNYPSVITAYQTDVTITLEFRDIDRDLGIDGASITSNISISINPLGSGQYEVTLQVSALAKGTHGFYITADAAGYVQKTLEFTLTIRIAFTYAIPTVGALDIPVGNDPVFYVEYWDTDHDVSIDAATVVVSNWPHTPTITYEAGNQRYRIDFITFDTDILEQNRIVTFNFSKGENYQFGIFTISVTIRTHNTDFRLVSSVEPTSSTGIFNISVYYGDLDNGVGITNSSNLVIVSVVNSTFEPSIFAIVPDIGQGDGFYIIQVPASQFGLGTQNFNITFTWTGPVAKYFDSYVIATASLVGEDSTLVLILSAGPTAYLGVMNYTFFYGELFSGQGITNTSNPYGDGNVHIYVSFQGISVDTSQIDITELVSEPGNYTIGFSTTIFDSTGLFYMNVYINWTAGVAPYYTNRLDVISVRVLARDTLLSVTPPTPTSYKENATFTFTFEDVTGGSSDLILYDSKMNISMSMPFSWSHNAGTFTIKFNTTVYGSIGPDTFTLSVEWGGVPFYANRTGHVISITINYRQTVIDYQPPPPTQWGDIVSFNTTWSDVTGGSSIGITSATLTLYDEAALIGSSFYNVTEHGSGVYQVDFDTTYYTTPGTNSLRVDLTPDVADWFFEDDQATQNFEVRYRATILSAEPLTRQPYNSTLTIILYYQDILTLDSIPDPGGDTTLDILTPGVWIYSYNWNPTFQYYEVTLETYNHGEFEIGTIYTLELLMSHSGFAPFYLPDNTFVSFQFRARISTLEPSESPLPTAYLDKANFTLLYFDVDGDSGIAGATISVFLGAVPLSEGTGNDYVLTDLGSGFYRLSVDTVSLGSIALHTLAVYANWTGSPFYSNRTLDVNINAIERPTNVELLTPPGLTRYTDNVTFTIAFTDLRTLQYVSISKSNLVIYRGVTLLSSTDFAFSPGALANTYDISINSVILSSGLSVDSNILISGLEIDLIITVDWSSVSPFYADDTTTLKPVIRNRIALLAWNPLEPTPLGDSMDLTFTVIDRDTENGISSFIILFDCLEVSPLLEGTHYTLVRGVGVDAGNYTIQIDTSTLVGVSSYTFYLDVVWNPSDSPYYANQTQRVITGSTRLIAASLGSGGADPSTVPFYTDVTIDVTFTDEDHSIGILNVMQQNVTVIWSHSVSEPASWSWTELGLGVYRIVVNTSDAGQSGIRTIEISIDWYPYTSSVAPPVSFQVRDRSGSTSVEYVPGTIFAGDDTYVIILINDTDAGYAPLLGIDDLDFTWSSPYPITWMELGAGRYNVTLPTGGMAYGLQTLQIRAIEPNYAFEPLGVGINLQAITIELVIPQNLVSPVPTVYWGSDFTFYAAINDTVHNNLVTSSISFSWSAGSGVMTPHAPIGNYTAQIDTSSWSAGTVAIIITAGSGNYAPTQKQITLIVNRIPTSLTPAEFSKTLPRGSTWLINVHLLDTLNTLDILGATVLLSWDFGTSLPLTEMGNGDYEFDLDTDETAIDQVYTITITAVKLNYEIVSTSVQISVTTTETDTYLDAYTASLVAVPWSTVVKLGVWVIAPDLEVSDPYYYQQNCTVTWEAEGGLSDIMNENLTTPGHYYFYLDTTMQGLSASTFTFHFRSDPTNVTFGTSSNFTSIIFQRIPTSVDSPPTTSYIWGWSGWINFTYWNRLNNSGIAYSFTEPTEALYSWGDSSGQATYFANGIYGVFINTSQLVPQSAPYQLSITFEKANYESKSGIFLLRVQPISSEIVVYSDEVNHVDSNTNLRVPYGDTLQITILYNSTENPIDTPMVGGMLGATWILPDGDAFLILPYGGKENLSLFDMGTGNYTFLFDTNMYQVYEGYSIYIELYLANRTRSSVRIVISVIDVPTNASFSPPPNASYSLVTVESEEPLVGSVSMYYGESISILVFFFDDWSGHNGEGITSASIVPIVGEAYSDLIRIEANDTYDAAGAGYYMITIYAPADIPINLNDRDGTVQITLTRDFFATKTITLRVHVSPTEFQNTMTQVVQTGVPLLLLVVLIGVLYSRVFSVPKRLRQINGQIKAIRKGKIPKPIAEAMSRQEIIADLFNDTYADFEITREPAQMPGESIDVAVPEMGELLIQLAILTNLNADELEEFQADISKMRISEQAAFVKEVIMQEAVRVARREGKTPEEVVEEVRLDALRRVSGEEGIVDPRVLEAEPDEEPMLLVGEEEPEEEVKPDEAPPEEDVSEPSEKLSQYELEELRGELESRGVPPHEIDTIMEQARVLPRELVEELVKSLGRGKKE
jgi:hypothetical protein